MDFSKIKKIFYIVAIISMLLSIKSKVFADSIDYIHYNDLSFAVSDNLNSHYLVCLISQDGSGNYHLEFKITEQPITILYATNFGYRIRFNSAMRNGNSFNGRNPDTNFFYNTTMQLSNIGTGETDLGASNYTTDVQVFSNYDIQDTSGNVIVPEFTNFTPPFFANPEELQDAPETVFIELGDYSANDYLYFHLLEVTNIMPASNNDSTYYYNDKTFALNKDSKYYKQLFDTTKYYYSIPRSVLGLNPDTSYFYVLTSSNTQIDNSINPITEGGDIYDVIMQDTTGIITQDMATNDKLQNINQEFNDYQQQQQEFQNQNTLTTETESDIDNNMNFNNSAPQFSSLFNGFFSRLTTIISDLGNYQDTDVITVHLPIPFTNDTIPISSDLIFSNQNNNFLKNIATLLWYFIFGKYFLYFLINTYWLITNGQFFDNYLTQKEAITGDML